MKLNPEHIIPTIVDNGFVLWESRAIIIYLNDKYAADDSLYPSNDTVRRAVINQRLFFEQGTLYKSFTDYYKGKFEKLDDLPARMEAVNRAVKQFDRMINDSEYAAGDTLSLADFSLIASMTSFVEAMNYDISEYPNVARWFAKVRSTIPGKELNEAGLEAMKAWIASLAK